ncbi:MAG: VCBS repeat-containing protein [Ginsengibacter sp.]
MKSFLILFFTPLIFYSTIYSQKFTEIAKRTGINHQFEVFEGSFGGGASVFDFNNDGFEDVFIAGGMAPDVLYLNKGDGTFENVYEHSGLKTKIKYVTTGAVSADFNKDGWRDLFITTITTTDNKEKIPRAPNLLFINNGNGTFRNATKEYGLEEYPSFSTAAMVGDVNEDGYPDVYVGNYFKDFEGKLSLIDDEVIVNSNQMARGFLLINKGGKKLVDEYADYGMTHKGFGFGGVFTDFDNDHDLDLIINNDFGYKNKPDLLLENEYPDEEFKDVSDTFKMNLAMNAMGTAVGDYNGDGLLDYYICNIKANKFMVNQGKGKPFINMSKQLGTSFSRISDVEGIYQPVSWGANFADFDNDGDLDLFVANGCLNPYVEPNPDYYFENVNGHYVNKSQEKNMADRGVSRGSVVFDFDNDGDLDLLVVNQKPINNNFSDPSPTLLYRNDSAKGNWLKVQLTGIDADKNGIG